MRCLKIPIIPRRRSQNNGPRRFQVRCQLAGNAGAADPEAGFPSKVISFGGPPPGRSKASLDLRRREDSERPFSHEFAEKSATDDGLAHDRLGVENIPFGLNGETPLGPEVP